MDRTIRRMTRAVAHRGPDAAGVWTDPAAGVALGHTRLAIIDCSPAGAQPMVCSAGRHVLVYNGEIYNADALRRDLEAGGHSFRGRSDSEVLLEGCAAWGARECLRRLNGMFAFALWDRAERCLMLARDRLGEKPLYWGVFGSLLLFGSELKALREHPGWAPEIDRDALASYLRWRCVPAPRSIYHGVSKLPPAHLLEWHAGRVEPRLEAYWRPPNGARPAEMSDTEGIDRVEALLADAVGRRMVSDVPLGAFLSGGIDSSLVVALMQAQSRRPVRSFSIGFNEAGFDEAPHARAVAAHLGTDHTELYVASDQALDLVPRLPEIYDEPFADASQIPTHLLAALTRRHVTVALSGDGGDELFAGYRHYPRAERVWRRLQALPEGLRRMTAHGLDGLPLPGRGMAGRALAPVLPPADRIDHWRAMLTAADADALYARRRSQWSRPETLLCAGREPPAMPAYGRDDVDFLTRMQLADLLGYLPDDILTKVDRATMAVALEARVPLLDHRLVALAFSLPRRLKVRDGGGKWVLRQVLARHVPPALTERPKAGFSVPLGAWLRGPLRDWAEELLDARRLEEEGYFQAEPIRRRWLEHSSGERDWQPHLWTVLMFQAWLQASGLRPCGTSTRDASPIDEPAHA